MASFCTWWAGLCLVLAVVAVMVGNFPQAIALALIALVTVLIGRVIAIDERFPPR